MTQFPHDQFAKNLLESLLAPGGQVTTALTIDSEVREIDVYFNPNNDPSSISDLGLLARCASQPAVFEPFRNPVSTAEIRSCMSKLYDLHRETVRQAKKDGQKITDAELPILWILTPTLAAPTLTGFGAINEVGWGNGVYLFPPLQKTAIIVIHQLPSIPETLWFRLLGKGKVQQQAISEVADSPLDSPHRTDALKLFGNLRFILEAQKSKKSEEQELIMQLSPLYLAEIQAAEDRGRQIGERREEVLIIRLLNRRVGDISLQVQEQIKSLPLEKLDDLGEALLDFGGMDDLTNWLDTNG
ncbi:DUF4351 domain-containing protein [Chamaesiphon sp. VAR_48_metabat_135_sub]|uniref:DUF4351 domain-containing protein n=1 Tax=Chamaesiphon sp. VAR_48_metabat_135_sub TaxID=2964699 RepID=UPI00286D0E43|nr:DUF4351 domain-containing protein [Chamaesiphon sp. VAR_48_metabat_135_sub]